MGMGIVFAVILAVVGLGALFVAPWIGGAFLLAALISVLIGVFWRGARSEEFREREDPETPHMPGPSS
jgi:hypothetical protein